MKKLIVLFLIVFLCVGKVDASTSSYVVMDASSGRVLASSNANERMLIASTTKIMTAIVAIENMDLDTTFTAGEEILSVYGSMIYLDVGEEMTLRDLLYGLMLQSGNDAAMVIATNVLGYDEFIKVMNSKAIEIGMKNTTFENPHGLDDDTKNYSTSYDMALLMRYAMKNSEFREITKTKKYTSKTNVEKHIWYNKNKLLSLYKNATGGKIGYTTKSKHIFASSASRGEEDLIVVTFKDTDRFNTHKNFYEKYFDEYDSYEILNKYTFVLKEDYYKKYHLYIKNDFNMMLSESEKDKLKFNIVLKKNVRVKNESEVGYVSVLLNNEVVHKEKIYAMEKMSKLKKIKNWLFFWK